MDKLTVYYSVNNGGDGSAYPKWFESQELADWDQDNMYEGWGESCTGSISFTGDNLKCLDEIQTKEGLLAEYILEDDDLLEKYINKFFPDKKTPQFNVEIATNRYYNILHDNVIVYREFAYLEESPIEEERLKILNKLNRI
jgi:hypothetical protein